MSETYQTVALLTNFLSLLVSTLGAVATAWIALQVAKGKIRQRKIDRQTSNEENPYKEDDK